MTLKKSVRAFTLIEILIVVAIIGLLASVLMRNIGSGYDSAQVKIARLFVQVSMKTSLDRYRLDLGSYPSTADGLNALLAAPANSEGSWHGPYIDADGGKLQNDPFGEPYVYRYPGTKNKTKYDLFSKGPDKTEGTADDIGNW